MSSNVLLFEFDPDFFRRFRLQKSGLTPKWSNFLDLIWIHLYRPTYRESYFTPIGVNQTPMRVNLAL